MYIYMGTVHIYMHRERGKREPHCTLRFSDMGGSSRSVYRMSVVMCSEYHHSRPWDRHSYTWMHFSRRKIYTNFQGPPKFWCKPADQIPINMQQQKQQQ